MKNEDAYSIETETKLCHNYELVHHYNIETGPKSRHNFT